MDKKDKFRLKLFPWWFFKTFLE